MVGFLSGQASPRNENMYGTRVRDVDDPKQYYFFDSSTATLSALLTTLADVPANFPEHLDFPEGFAFPPSFEYEMNVGLVSGKGKVSQTKSKVILDAENNRVRTDRLSLLFEETDREVKVYDFTKLRVLVSDPHRKICFQQKIADISPMSVTPRDADQVMISDAFQDLWNPSSEKTRYLGQHQIFTTTQLTTPRASQV
jgi:hypothetical protein